MRAPRAAIYCRISKDAEEGGLGVVRQESDCRVLADRSGLEVVEVYVDNDISASTASRRPRPAYDRLLVDARSGRFDVLLSYSNSRLTRRPRELEDLIDLHASTGVRISTVVSGEDDLSTADGRMVARVKAGVDAAEAERTAERVKRKQKERAQAGLYNGPRPFGYDFATDEHGRVLTGKAKTLVVNEPEAQVLREVVERFLTGEAIWSLTKDLNDRGVTTTRGGPWHTQTLRRMLLRWVHVGYRKHQLFENGEFVGKAELYPAAWEAIIDRDTHERVLARLTDPTRRVSRSTEARYLLTSLARCGACAGYLVGTTGYEYTIKGSYVRKDGTRSPDKVRVYPPTYKCPHAGCHAVSRRMDVVDELVSAVVVRLLEREGVEIFGGNNVVATAAQARIDALGAKLQLLTDRWTDDVITDEQFERGTARLRPQLEQERERLRLAQPATDLRGFTGAAAGAAWEDADVVTRKRVLRFLGEAVGLAITLDPVGAGAAGKKGATGYEGIRVEATGNAC